MDASGRFDVTFRALRSNTLGHVWGVDAPSDTVLALDRSAVVSAFGAGMIALTPEHVEIIGQRTIRSTAAIATAGALAIGAGFLVAVMVQAEQWPPLGLGILAFLLAGCGTLLVRARRTVPFRWRVRWRDVTAFTEVGDDTLAWLLSVTGEHVGTFGFVASDREALRTALTSARDAGLVKVRFGETLPG